VSALGDFLDDALPAARKPEGLPLPTTRFDAATSSRKWTTAVSPGNTALPARSHVP
jgi:hypothetical protein